MIKFSAYVFLNESLDSTFETSRNSGLEDTVNSQFGDRMFAPHTAAFQSDHMKSSGISVLRFMGKPLKQIEYHIHDEHAKPGQVTEPDRKSMLHALKIIHDDASDQIKTHGRSIYIHSANSEQYKKYLALGSRLAIKHGYKLKELGLQPYTTNYEAKGHAFILREESGYVDLLGRPFTHIDEQIVVYNNQFQ